MPTGQPVPPGRPPNSTPHRISLRSGRLSGSAGVGLHPREACAGLRPGGQTTGNLMPRLAQHRFQQTTPAGPACCPLRGCRCPAGGGDGPQRTPRWSWDGSRVRGRHGWPTAGRLLRSCQARRTEGCANVRNSGGKSRMGRPRIAFRPGPGEPRNDPQDPKENQNTPGHRKCNGG